MFKLSFILISSLLISNTNASTKKNALDKAHASFSESITKFSDDIDSFFANKKHVGVVNKSKLTISLDSYFREDRGPYAVPDIDYRLILPRTEKSLRLIFQSDNDDNDRETRKTTEGRQGSQQTEQNSTTAALRYMVEKSGIEFSADTGVIVNIPIVIFSKFRAKKSIKFKKWVFKINEQLKWVNSRGITSDLDLDFDRRLSKTFLFRMVNNTFWNDQDYIVRFENGPSLFQKIDEKRALSYHAYIVSVNKPSLVVDNYLLQLTYRQIIYSNWVFMNVTPFLHFPRAENFHRTPGLIIGLDAVFGKL